MAISSSAKNWLFWAVFDLIYRKSQRAKCKLNMADKNYYKH